MKSFNHVSERLISPRVSLLSIVALLIILAPSSAVFAQGQWTTTGNDISNTNSGNVGVGTPTPGELLEVIGNVRVGSAPATLTQINDSDGITASDTTITVDSTAHYPLTGTLVIEREVLTYTGKTATSFIGVTRGMFGSTASAHVDNTPVSNYLLAVQGPSGLSPKFVVAGSGNVGIRSNTPNASLHIGNGGDSAPMTYNMTPQSHAEGILFNHYTVVADGFRRYADIVALGKWDGRAGGSIFRFFTNPHTSGDAVERMRIDRNGNIGIGEAAPAYKLDVAGQVRSASGGFVFPDGTIQTSAATASSLTLSASNISAGQFGGAGGGQFSFSGKVGIGTAAPTAGLDVQTPVRAPIAHGVRLQQTLTAGDNNAHLTGLYINPTFVNGLAANITHNALLTGAGNVGIGTTETGAGVDIQNPGVAGRLATYGTSYGTRIQQTLPSSGNQSITTALYVNPTFADGQAFGVRHNGLVVTSGDVGIGTVTPSTKLDVQGGAINASGGLCINGDCKTSWAQVGGGSTNSGQWTTNGANIHFSTGNVGVGTSAPANRLHVAGNARFDGQGRVYLGAGAAIGARGLEIVEETPTTISIRHHDPGVAWRNIAINPHGGAVGIGTLTPNPAYKLDVAGNLNASGTITGGNIAAKYQDVAEWVPSRQQLAAGTVVILDPDQSNHVMAAIKSYDTRVAGVISAAPGVILGEAGAGKVMVATTGRVKVKVDATRAAVRVGDLLVTSDTHGLAMRSEPLDFAGTPMHRPGTLIGKALEPLAQGTGEILVLLSLQ